MKKTIRLTESDLTKLVKRIIQEQEWSDEEEESSNECENLFEDMGYVFDDFMSQVETLSDETESEEMYYETAEEFYYELESQLGEILNMAEEMGCEDIPSLEEVGKDYLDKFAEFLGINSNLY